MTLAAAAGIQAGSGLLQYLLGGQAEERPMQTGMMAPGQLELLKRMLASFQNGGGEFGFGPAAQAGHQTLARMFGDRGIPMTSGVAQGSFAQMMAQAMQGDAQNRRNHGMQLIGAQPGSVINYDRRGFGMGGAGQ